LAAVLCIKDQATCILPVNLWSVTCY